MEPNETGLRPVVPGEAIVHVVRPPQGDDPEAIAEWLLALQGAGIRRICSLLGAEEVESFDVVLDVAYRQMFGRDEVYTDESMEEDELVDADRLFDALAFVDEAVQLGRPVAVHCGEMGFRALQLLALWLVTAKAMPAPAAVAAVRATGALPAKAAGYLPNDDAVAAHVADLKAAWDARRG